VGIGATALMDGDMEMGFAQCLLSFDYGIEPAWINHIGWMWICSRAKNLWRRQRRDVSSGFFSIPANRPPRFCWN